jgi:CDGSH-type Zn-finger protein
MIATAELNTGYLSLVCDNFNGYLSFGGCMAQVTITVRKNGPLRIEDPNGVIEMVDAEGNKYDLTGKPAFSLCRCGASANPPFCDGSHKGVFQVPVAAIAPETPTS